MRIFLCWLLLAGALPAIAQVPQKTPGDGVADESRRVVIPRVEVPPTLEDYVDGVPRREEVAVSTFVQREPGDGIPASQATAAYLSYDDERLYVVFVARDEPGRVRATLSKRESFGNDDFVGVILDTFRDRRRAYLFIVNPYGVQLDGVSTDGEDDDYSYDTIWESEGRLTAFGFVVRIAIPFKSLRFSPARDQEWGIALARAISRNNETSFWPYITRRVSGVGQQLATAAGLQQISPGRNIQFIPYAAFTGARFLDESRPAFVRDGDGRAGIDGKVVVKDAFTFDMTFNPDFSQVESDEPQVTINQRFEVFFPEKRPFFIENASYFETPINLFFSRRVADPRAGVRMTGKAAGWTLAALAIDDRAPEGLLDPGASPVDSDAAIGVLRAQRDLPRQSAIGVLATARRFGDQESHVVSVDGRYKMSDTWVLTGQVAYSDVTGADGIARQGPALTLELDRSGRNWGAFIMYEDIGADFRVPLGFVPRVDTREFRPFVRYTWFPDKGPLVSLRPELSGGVIWNHEGVLQDWEVNAEFGAELKGQTQLDVRYEESMERFANIEFRKHDASFGFETAWLKWLEGSFGVERGRDINFFPSEGLLPFLVDATEAEASLTLKPLPALRLEQRYLFTRLQARAGLAATRPGAVIVDNHIWRSRASYQFTRSLSLRAIVDYSGVLPDTRLIALQREKRFAVDTLFTYLVNPWTAFYVGYTDGYGNLEIDPVSRDRLRLSESTFNSLGRQVFIKMSYLLRF
jgi:hypothetical protein